MKKSVLILFLALCTSMSGLYAQQAQPEAVMTLSGIDYSGEQQGAYLTLANFSSDPVVLKSYKALVMEIPGVVNFDPVLAEGTSSGYAYLYFKTTSPEALQQMLRAFFCALEIQRVKVNQQQFDNCTQITLN